LKLESLGDLSQSIATLQSISSLSSQHDCNQFFPHGGVESLPHQKDPFVEMGIMTNRVCNISMLDPCSRF
jgi:hypothetical protein